MPAASRSSGVASTWRRLSPEQRVAGVGAVLLIVSTFGPFSFVEAAIVLTAGAVLLLLKKRAEARLFHLPFGDGTVIAAAGLWSALLIVVRLFDRPLGQNLLALACAAILTAAGVRERAKRPADDLPIERAGRRGAGGGSDWLAEKPSAKEAGRARSEARGERLAGEGVAARRPESPPAASPPQERAAGSPGEAPTRPLEEDSATRPLPDDPPELRLGEDARGE